MSQAIIDFCDGLKTTLLEVEERLTAAKSALETDAHAVESEAKQHIEKALDDLSVFRERTASLAQSMQAQFPEQAASAERTLKSFGQEAQLALNHALVMLAGAVALSAEKAGDVLKSGAHKAHKFADTLKHHSAVTIVNEDVNPS